MSDYSFGSSPSPSEATLAFEPLHEGRVYSKAVLETLGVDAVRSPEEVMKRYQDGTAQAEGVVEWAEVEGMCIVLPSPHDEGSRIYWSRSPPRRRAYIIAPADEPLSMPLVFEKSPYFESTTCDGDCVTSPASLPLGIRLYTKRLLISPAFEELGVSGQSEYCWKVEHAFLQTAEHLIKMPGLSDLP